MGDAEPEDPPDEPEPPPDPSPSRPTRRTTRSRSRRVAQMDAPLEVQADVLRADRRRARRAGRARPRWRGTGARDAVDGPAQLGADRPAQRRRPRARDRDRPGQPPDHVRGPGVRRRLQVARRRRVVVPALARRAVALDRRARHLPGNTQVVWAGTGESAEPAAARRSRAPASCAAPTAARPGRSRTRARPILDARVHALAAHPTDDDRCWAATDARPLPDDRRRQHVDAVPRRPRGHRRRLRHDRRQPAAVRGAQRLRRRPGPARAAPPARRSASTSPTTPTSRRCRSRRVLTDALPDGSPDTDRGRPAAPARGHVPRTGGGRRRPGRREARALPGRRGGLRRSRALRRLRQRQRRDHFGIFRCRNLDAATPARRSTGRASPPLPRLPATRGRARYNLALAVSPANPNHLAFGMVELYLQREREREPAHASRHWKRAQMWDLFIDRARPPRRPPRASSSPRGRAAPFDGGARAPGRSCSGTRTTAASRRRANWQGSTTLPDRGDEPDTLAPTRSCPSRPARRLAQAQPRHLGDADVRPHAAPAAAVGARLRLPGQRRVHRDRRPVVAAPARAPTAASSRSTRTTRTGCSSRGRRGIAESRFPGVLRDALPLLGEGVQDGLWPRELSDGFLAPRPARCSSPRRRSTRRSRGACCTARRNRVYGTRLTTGRPLDPGAASATASRSSTGRRPRRAHALAHRGRRHAGRARARASSRSAS